MDSDTNKIVFFTLGEGPDHCGRSISDTLNMSDEALARADLGIEGKH